VSTTINGHKNGALFAYDKPVTVQMRGLQFDKQSNHWSGSLVFIANGDVVTAMAVAGHFDEMIEVPVLKREVRGGDVIRETDVEIRDFATSHTHAETVRDLSSLIGKSPLRSISPYRPIRTNEIASPAIIKKDALVQMRYTVPGMEISTSGQAITQGAQGDVINVRNVSSKKIVRAVIQDSSTVNILMPTQETSQLTGGDHATN
jgi:flagella basal body P-ring formation protein FlgA